MNITAKIGCEIILGKTGENDATIVSFPIVEQFRAELGKGGAFTILNKGPEDDHAYPCVTEISGNELRWIVKAPDTRAAGYGRCEVIYVNNEGIKKSITYDTRIFESVGEEVGEVPEPEQSWVNMVVQAGLTAEQAKEAIVNLGVFARTVSAETVARVIKDVDSSGRVTLTFEIPRGQTGDDGIGIADITETISTEDGGVNEVTVTLTDGTEKLLYVRNGRRGLPGNPGDDGHTPEKGIDYFTDAEIADIVARASAEANRNAADAVQKAEAAVRTAGSADTAAKDAVDKAEKAVGKAQNAEDKAGNAERNSDTALSKANEVHNAYLAGELKGDPGYTPIKNKDYFDGLPGRTPIKGFDYWTEEDKAEIDQHVDHKVSEETMSLKQDIATQLNQYEQATTADINTYKQQTSQDLSQQIATDVPTAVNGKFDSLVVTESEYEALTDKSGIYFVVGDEP